MLVIVEGCDGVGKSTVCDRIAEIAYTDFRCDVARYKAGVPVPGHDPFATYERGLPDFRTVEDAIAICDRWHWGEPIYSELFGRENTLTTAGFRHVELYAAARGAVVLHLENDAKVVRRRLRRRGDDLVRPGDVQRVMADYWMIARLSALPVVAAVDPSGDRLRDVVRLARTRMGMCAHLRRFPSYVGGPSPDVLLVGERRGGDPDQPDHAAFVPRGATSGRFLLEALPSSMWRHVGLVNAFEDDVPLLWTTMFEPNVVALGRKAYERLRDQGVACGAVPHPQYVRRFHHAAKIAYGRRIQQVAVKQEDALSWRP